MGSGTSKFKFSLQTAVTVMIVSLWAPDLSSGVLSQKYGFLGDYRLKSCDPALPLTNEEKDSLLSSLKETKTGREILTEYEEKYGTLNNLVIQWDAVSYSQLMRKTDRSPAAVSGNKPQSVVCIHLSKKLPDIEHLADLAHEMVHASRLSQRVLLGEAMAPDEFVKHRIAGRGGEADAFRMECAVKYDVLGYWDHLCRPYVENESGVNVDKVVSDLYAGTLSASLTGEAYPIMLAKQYKRMLERRALNGILK